MYNRSDILKCINSEFCKDCNNSDCNKVHTRDDWKTDLNNDFFVGAIVSEDIVDDCMNVLPPRTMGNNILQMGEPYSHAYDVDKKIDRATWATFARTEKGWVYCGNCFAGSINNIK